MEETQIIKILCSRSLNWKQVRGLRCVNTTYENYYIKLCAYDRNGIPAISLNVNDNDTGDIDIFAKHYIVSEYNFQKLLPIYNHAIATSQKIGVQA